MTSFKILSLITLAITITAATVVENTIKQSNNLIVGQREDGDKLYYQEHITEFFLPSGEKLILNRTIRTKSLYYITQVECIDIDDHGTGAEVTITAGGPRFNYVDLTLTSQKWHGIYFNVTVYAKRAI